MEELNFVIFAEGLKNWQRDLLYWILQLVASLFPGATFMGYAAPAYEPLEESTLSDVLRIIQDQQPGVMRRHLAMFPQIDSGVKPKMDLDHG